MSRKRVKPGDVLEVVVDDQTAYMQYVGEHPEYGGVIWVVPRTFDTARQDLDGIITDDGYYAFYPARMAVSRGFAKAVGSVPLGDRDVPRTLRRAGMRGQGGNVHSWIVTYETGEEAVRQALNDTELRLPIAAIWNHEMLLHRIVEGWRPQHAC